METLIVLKVPWWKFYSETLKKLILIQFTPGYYKKDLRTSTIENQGLSQDIL